MPQRPVTLPYPIASLVAKRLREKGHQAMVSFIVDPQSEGCPIDRCIVVVSHKPKTVVRAKPEHHRHTRLI